MIGVRHLPGLNGDEAVETSRFETHGQGSAQETPALAICHGSGILLRITAANGGDGE